MSHKRRARSEQVKMEKGWKSHKAGLCKKYGMNLKEGAFFETNNLCFKVDGLSVQQPLVLRL